MVGEEKMGSWFEMPEIDDDAEISTEAFEEDIIERAISALNDISQLCFLRAQSKGFPTPRSFDEAELVLAKSMLIVSELGEAASALQKHQDDKAIEEYADGLIRYFDLMGGLGIDIGNAVAAKLAFNQTRPERHGGKRI